MGFFDKLKEGLKKTKDSFNDKVDGVFKVFKRVDDELFDELEEALIEADVGVQTSMEIIERLREAAKKERITESEELSVKLREIIAELMEENDEQTPETNGLKIILVIGVNGVGKTTPCLCRF